MQPIATTLASWTSPAINTSLAPTRETALRPTAEAGGEPSPELRRAFDDFVGKSFYSQMLAALRKTVDEPAYLHGGKGEEMFRGQLDQLIVDDLNEATRGDFTGPMFELFNLPRP